MNGIDKELYDKLVYLGIIPDETRKHNVGKSDYSKRIIQPWAIIQEYELDYWDGDIVKRVLRTKEGEPKEMDYEKIIHICQEKLRQIKYGCKIANANKTKIEEEEYEVSEDQESIIKRGDVFMCLNDMYSDSLQIYTKGELYKSELHGCITDNQGVRGRYWSYPSSRFQRMIKK